MNRPPYADLVVAIKTEEEKLVEFLSSFSSHYTSFSALYRRINLLLDQIDEVPSFYDYTDDTLDQIDETRKDIKEALLDLEASLDENGLLDVEDPLEAPHTSPSLSTQLAGSLQKQADELSELLDTILWIAKIEELKLNVDEYEENGICFGVLSSLRHPLPLPAPRTSCVDEGCVHKDFSFHPQPLSHSAQPKNHM